ncbi:unnamed protein product, partial [marine sediment metagenome]
RAKEANEIERLFVIGCLSQRYKKELESEIPEVDQYFGVNDLAKIIRFLGAEYKKNLIGERVLITPKHYAYLKISDPAKDFISEKGYDIQFGARPLKRALQKYLEDPMAEVIIKASMTEGDVISVGLDKKKDEIIISIKKQKVKQEKE